MRLHPEPPAFVAAMLSAVAALLPVQGVVAQSAVGQERPRTDLQGNPLPKGAVARLGSVRFRHNSDPPAVAFSPDGTLLSIVLRGEERPGFLWDLRKSAKLVDFAAPTPEAHTVAFAPDGKTVAIATERAVSLWDPATGKPLGRELREREGVLAIAFSPDGKLLAIGGNLSRGEIRPCIVLWEVAGGKEARILAGHRTPIHALAFSRDGKRLVTCGVATEKHKGEILTHTVASGAIVHRLDLPRKALRLNENLAGDLVPSYKRMRLSPEGSRLAFRAANENDVVVWDLAKGRELLSVAALGDCFALAEVGKRLITGGRQPLRRWDADSGVELGTFGGWMAGAALRGTNVLAISPDGMHVVSGGDYYHRDEGVYHWETVTGREAPLFTGHGGAVTSLAFSADGKLVLTGCADNRVRLWDVSGKHLRQFGTGQDVAGVAISPNGSQLAMLAQSGSVHLLDLPKGNSSRVIKAADDGLSAFAGHIGFVPQDRSLIAVMQDLTLRRWGPRGEKVSQLVGAKGSMSCAGFSPDFAVVAAAWNTGDEGDRGLGLWEVGTGRAWWRLPLAPGQSIGPVAISADGALLAASEVEQAADGSGLRLIRLREAATGQTILQLKLRDQSAVSLAFTLDGRSLVSAHGQGSTSDVVVWDVVGGKESRRLRGHTAPVWRVATSPDGRLLASGGADNTALLWDASQFSRTVPSRVKALTATEQQALWSALTSRDAAAAYRAMRELTTVPGQAVPLLHKQLPTVREPDPEEIEKLIRDLGSNRFAVRQRAQTALEKHGSAAHAALQKAAGAALPLETQRRVAGLLQTLEMKMLTPEQLRVRRGVTVLEWIHDAEARRALEGLARDAARPFLREQAQAALRRLARR